MWYVLETEEVDGMQMVAAPGVPWMEQALQHGDCGAAQVQSQSISNA